MKPKGLDRDTLRQILKTRSRFISILLMVALGVFVLVGLTVTGPIMRRTVERDIQQGKMEDMKISSSFGLEPKDLELISSFSSIDDVELSYAIDVLDGKGIEQIRLMSLHERMDLPVVSEGRLPRTSEEIFLDQDFQAQGMVVGDSFEIIEKIDKFGEKGKDKLSRHRFTISGFGTSPSFASRYFKGTGFDGSAINGFAVVLPDVFLTEHPQEARLLFSDMKGIPTYEKTYEKLGQAHKKEGEDIFAHRPAQRLDEMRGKVEKEIRQGRKELSDGRKRLREGEQTLKEKAAELEKGRRAEAQGKRELEQGRKEGRALILKSEGDLQRGEATLQEKIVQLREGEQKLQEGKEEWKKGEEKTAQGREAYEKGLLDYTKGWDTWLSSKAELERGEEKLRQGEEKLAQGKVKYAQGLEEYNAGWKKLSEKEPELAAARAELESGRKKLEAGERELAEQEKKLQEGKAAIAAGERQLAEMEKQVEEGKAALPQIQQGIDRATGTARELQGKKAELENTIVALKEQIGKGQSAGEDTSGLENSLQQAQGALQQVQAGLGEAEKTLRDLEGKRAEIQAGLSSYEQGVRELEAQKAQIAQGETALARGRDELDQSRGQLVAGEEKLAQGQAAYEAGKEKLISGKEELEKSKAEIASGERELEENRRKLASGKEELKAGEEKLAASKEELSKAQRELAAGEEKLISGKKELSDREREIQEGKEKIRAGQKDLEKGREELLQGKRDLAEKIASGERKLAQGSAELKRGEEKYREGKEKFLEEKEKAREKLRQGEEDILRYEDILEILKEPSYPIVVRDKNPGIYNALGDARRVDGLAMIFPVFFFLIVMLLSSTTMSRMVEEERTQIGTLKALGYTGGEIGKKYFLYGGIAALVGGVIGGTLGNTILPYVIGTAYFAASIFQDLLIEPYPVQWGGAIIVGLLATSLVAAFTVRHSMKEKAAELMRPKPPQEGSRIFPERWTLLWSRLSFLQKVTARNLFRYKKRAAMTLFGVMGCTALLILGFGIDTSVNGLLEKQFLELTRFDLLVISEKRIDPQAYREEMKKLYEDPRLEQVTSGYFSFGTVKVPGHEDQMVTIIVPMNVEEFQKQVTLRHPRGREFTLPEDGVVVTEKLAHLLKKNVGMDLAFTEEKQEHSVKIQGITEGYAGHYLYMSRSTYEKLKGSPVEKNGEMVMVKEEKISDFNEILSDVQKQKTVLTAISFNDLWVMMDQYIQAISSVVAVIVIASALLAAVVLYNLTNINIEERQRELSTIKVLGFFNNETLNYVYRETGTLTLLGVILGCGLGKLLHYGVLQVVVPDTVILYPVLGWKNYVIPGVITLLISLGVRFFIRRRLKNIDMVEALKAVE